MQYHATPCNTMQYHAIPCITMHFYIIQCNTMQYHAIQWNTLQCHAIPCNIMQYHAIPCNTMQYHAIPCNTMQYHASLITADGAFHCPVGSIMAIFLFTTTESAQNSFDHKKLCQFGDSRIILFRIWMFNLLQFLQSAEYYSARIATFYTKYFNHLSQNRTVSIKPKMVQRLKHWQQKPAGKLATSNQFYWTISNWKKALLRKSWQTRLSCQ